MNKEDHLIRCIDLLVGNYTRESGVMKALEKDLRKMTREGLARLSAVLLTRVVVKPIDYSKSLDDFHAKHRKV